MSMSIEKALDKIYEALKGADTDGQGSIEYSLTKIAETLETGSNVNLPAVTATDNGDVLTVVEGNWSKADIPSQLPEVTATDNGDVLTVVEGAWAKAAPSGGGVMIVNITYNEETYDYSIDKTYAEISSALSASQPVMAITTDGFSALAVQSVDYIYFSNFTDVDTTFSPTTMGVRRFLLSNEDVLSEVNYIFEVNT